MLVSNSIWKPISGSIRSRVEIIGTLRDAVPVDLNGSESELIDQLSRAKTLGAIIERMNKHLAAHLGKPAAEPVGRATRLIETENHARRKPNGWSWKRWTGRSRISTARMDWYRGRHSHHGRRPRRRRGGGEKLAGMASES